MSLLKTDFIGLSSKTSISFYVNNKFPRYSYSTINLLIILSVEYNSTIRLSDYKIEINGYEYNEGDTKNIVIVNDKMTQLEIFYSKTNSPSSMVEIIQSTGNTYSYPIQQGTGITLSNGKVYLYEETIYASIKDVPNYNGSGRGVE